MAGFNGRGPYEEGPRTGRGLGKCNKEKRVSEAWYNKKRDGKGRKHGYARGRGRGYGHRNYGEHHGGPNHGGNYYYNSENE